MRGRDRGHDRPQTFGARWRFRRGVTTMGLAVFAVAAPSAEGGASPRAPLTEAILGMRKQPLGAVILSVALAACGPRAGATPGPLTAAAAEAARARWADASPESLERGRQLFLLNCHRCHEYPDRPTYEVDEWPSIIQRMGRKAHLSDADARLVLRFVLADRQATVSGTSP